MLIRSYREYLNLLDKKPNISILKKGLLAIFVICLIITGISSAFYYYQYNKQAPERAETQYLESASSGYYSAKQSISEVQASFQVAGAKVEAVDKLKEASTSASGFFTALDDAEKTIALLESTKESLLFQKSQIPKLYYPPKFDDINNQLIAFYDEGVKLCNALTSDHKFAKEFLLASGPNFYLPKLSEENLWTSGKNEEIIAYYQKIKDDADTTLGNLSQLSLPDDYKNDIKTQLDYLELLVNTSTKIIEILSQENNPDVEEATQLEKAYQVLIGAKRANENNSQKLLDFRLNFLTGDNSLAKFANLKVRQNSLDLKFNEILQNRLKTKNRELPVFIQKIKNTFTNI